MPWTTYHPQFSWYGKNPSIHELRTFVLYIYPITSSPKKLDKRTQELSFMGYTDIRATMKWWDPHRKRLKYCSCTKFDEHNHNFEKVWSPGSELMLDTTTSTLPTLKIDLSYHPFIKDSIFEGNVNFPPRGTPICITTQYYEHHNMSYISQSENNSPCNHAFPDRNRINVCILVIGIKEPTSAHQFLESISSQKLTGKCNRVHVITAFRGKYIIITNLQ